MTQSGPDHDLPGAVSGSRQIGSASQRGSLTRRKILGAAVEVIGADGLLAFSMRRVAARFGVEAMALYHYFHGREDLLDGIVEYVIDDLQEDRDVHLVGGDWQDYLVRLAHGVRRIALLHPQVFPLIATRPPAAPWVRPPLRSLKWMESFLGTLQRSGFSDESSVAAYRAFSSFLLGHLLLEVSALGADTGPVLQERPHPPRRTDLAEFPILRRLEPDLSEDHSTEEFDDSLENLIDRLNINEHWPTGVQVEHPIVTDSTSASDTSPFLSILAVQRP